MILKLPGFFIKSPFINVLSKENSIKVGHYCFLSMKIKMDKIISFKIASFASYVLVLGLVVGNSMYELRCPVKIDDHCCCPL